MKQSRLGPGITSKVVGDRAEPGHDTGAGRSSLVTGNGGWGELVETGGGSEYLGQRLNRRRILDKAGQRRE